MNIRPETTSGPTDDAWDAIVIGAGPAGAMAARELARGGARVLLVDKQAFPREKVCGGCLNGHALGVLESVGLGTLARRAGGVSLGAFRVGVRGQSYRLDLPAGMAVSRDRFDADLVGAAVEAGVSFSPRTEARVELATGTTRRVRLRPRHRERAVEARIVLIATGLGALGLPPGAAPAVRIARGSKIGTGCFLEGDGDDYETGTIHMAVGRAGYVGLVRLGDGRLHVAGAIRPEALHEGDGPGAVAEVILQGAGFRPPAGRGDRLGPGGRAGDRPDGAEGHRAMGAPARQGVGSPARAGRPPPAGRLPRRRRDARPAPGIPGRHGGRRPGARFGERIASSSEHPPPPRGGELTMPATIAGIATALPPYRIEQSESAEAARAFSCETREQERLFAALFRRSGVKARHSVVLETAAVREGSRQSFYGATSPTTRERMEQYERHAGPLATRAAAGAIEGAGVDPGRVTHVVTVSCSGFMSPGVDHAMIRGLGLRAEVARTHVGFMGCHALLNGLRIARSFVEADASACVLLCAVELCSLHYQYGWDAERMVANALFADGAAAMVVVPAGARVDRSSYTVLADGSTLLPDCEGAMSWRIGDNGFLMTLSPRVPELIASRVRPWLGDWLARHDLTTGAVGSWAVHPGGPRIVSAFGEAMGLDRSELSTSLGILAECGNMSSPTLGFILRRLRDEGARRPCVAIGFGPGLAVEAALLG